MAGAQSGDDVGEVVEARFVDDPGGEELVGEAGRREEERPRIGDRASGRGPGARTGTRRGSGGEAARPVRHRTRAPARGRCAVDVRLRPDAHERARHEVRAIVRHAGHEQAAERERIAGRRRSRPGRPRCGSERPPGPARRRRRTRSRARSAAPPSPRVDGARHEAGGVGQMRPPWAVRAPSIACSYGSGGPVSAPCRARAGRTRSGGDRSADRCSHAPSCSRPARAAPRDRRPRP